MSRDPTLSPACFLCDAPIEDDTRIANDGLCDACLKREMETEDEENERWQATSIR